MRVFGFLLVVFMLTGCASKDLVWWRESIAPAAPENRDPGLDISRISTQPIKEQDDAKARPILPESPKPAISDFNNDKPSFEQLEEASAAPNPPVAAAPALSQATSVPAASIQASPTKLPDMVINPDIPAPSKRLGVITTPAQAAAAAPATPVPIIVSSDPADITPKAGQGFTNTLTEEPPLPYTPDTPTPAAVTASNDSLTQPPSSLAPALKNAMAPVPAPPPAPALPSTTKIIPLVPPEPSTPPVQLAQRSPVNPAGVMVDESVLEAMGQPAAQAPIPPRPTTITPIAPLTPPPAANPINRAVTATPAVPAAPESALPTPPPAMAQTKSNMAVYGHGNLRCKDLNSALQANADLSLYQSWLNGFVSSYNAFASTTGDVALGADAAVLFNWLKTYCAANEEEFIQRSGSAMIEAVKSGALKVNP